MDPYRTSYLFLNVGQNDDLLANRIARTIFRILAGNKYKEIGYMRGDPHEAKVKMLVNRLKALGVNVFHTNHQTIVSDRRMVVEKTGIVLTPQ